MPAIEKLVFTLIIMSFLMVTIVGCDHDSPGPKEDILIDSTFIDNDTTEVSDSTKVIEDTIEYISGAFTLANLNSGKVLDVIGSSIENKANVVQWGSSEILNQQWTISHDDGGYIITSVLSGFALSVSGRDTLNGASIIQSRDLLLPSQRWDITLLEDSIFKITNKNSGRALEVIGGYSFDAADVIQWEYHGGDHQHWRLTRDKVSTANGQLSWTWTSESVPADAKERINAAMNAAVDRYNKGINLVGRTLTVEYNAGVQTADANINGHIRFGPGVDYQNERTALHEIAHTYGVGTSGGWYNLISANDGSFLGENTNYLIQIYDGQDAKIMTGSSHFWPYGLNYNNEWSEENGRRHVEIVSSMMTDGIY